MRIKPLFFIAALLLTAAVFFGQTDQLLSEPGPTFQLQDNQLPNPQTFIAYGDVRFTDPVNTTVSNPRIRLWLAQQIAKAKPGALIVNGDIPLAGSTLNDYAVFSAETKSWRDAHLHVYPTLGNHELVGPPKQALENWWGAFPEIRNRRWYSVQLGSRVYVLALDSGSSLLPGSIQAVWIQKQIEKLPSSIDFVIVAIHHPPVADVQTHIAVDHNPRPNEIALRDYLSKAALTSHARFLVSAGHIHNYERSEYQGVTYLVSGGGGAAPYFVERTPQDLYKSVLFPNYHFVKLSLERDRLRGTMYRVANPEKETLSLEVKDDFDIAVKPR